MSERITVHYSKNSKIIHVQRERRWRDESGKSFVRRAGRVVIRPGQLRKVADQLHDIADLIENEARLDPDPG